MDSYSIGKNRSTFLLFFSDDLIVFGQTKENQVRVIIKVLDTLCSYSGHSVNMQKSNIFFSRGVEEDLGRRINRLFGFQMVQNLGYK